MRATRFGRREIQILADAAERDFGIPVTIDIDPMSARFRVMMRRGSCVAHMLIDSHLVEIATRDRAAARHVYEMFRDLKEKLDRAVPAQSQTPFPEASKTKETAQDGYNLRPAGSQV